MRYKSSLYRIKSLAKINAPYVKPDLDGGHRNRITAAHKVTFHTANHALFMPGYMIRSLTVKFSAT